LVYQEKSEDRASASKREYEIKKMDKNTKLLLIKSV
jgi:predicted GIY-YIG superfamily endonuclease